LVKDRALFYSLFTIWSNIYKSYHKGQNIICLMKLNRIILRELNMIFHWKIIKNEHIIENSVWDVMNVIERSRKTDVMNVSHTKKEKYCWFVFKWLTMHLKNYTNIIAYLSQDAKAGWGE